MVHLGYYKSQHSIHYSFYSLLVLFFSTTLNSCSSDIDYLNSGACYPLEDSIYSLQIDVSRISTTVTNDTRYKHKIFDYSEIENLYFGLETLSEFKKIDVFKLDSGYVKSIHLSDPTFNKQISSIKVLTSDSIWVIQNEPYHLTLINGSGKILRSYKIDNAPVDWSYSSDYYHSASNFQKPIFYDNKLVVFLTPYDFFSHADRNHFELMAIFDLETQTWLKLFGEPDGIYFTKDKISLPFDFTLPSCVKSRDYLWVAYPLSSNIYKYDLEGNPVGIFCGKSKYLDRLDSPPSLNSDIQQEVNYLISAPFYGTLNYHSEINSFSRFVFHGIPVLTDDGLLNSFCKRDVSIQFFDKDFNFLNEKSLGNKFNFYPGHFLVTSTGFITHSTCEKIVAPEDSLLLNTKLTLKLKKMEHDS